MRDHEGWPRLEARAHWFLEHPDQIEPLDILQGRTMMLRLWSHRRFGAHVSWGLFVSEDKEGQALVRELTWGEPVDLQRMSSRLGALKRRPEEDPSLRVRDAVVDPSALDPFLRRAAEVLPAGTVRSKEAGSSDHEFGIEGYRDLSFVRFVWRGEDPGEYRDAAAWTCRLRTLLEASLRDREIA